MTRSFFRGNSNIMIVTSLLLVTIVSVLLSVNNYVAFAVIAVLVATPIAASMSNTQLAVLGVLFSSLFIYRWDIGLFQLSIYRIILVLLLSKLFFGLRPRYSNLRIDLLSILIGLTIVWDIIGAIYSPTPLRGLQLVSQEIPWIVTYFVIVNSVYSTTDASFLVKAFIGSVLIAVTLGFMQWIYVFILRIPFSWPLWQFVKIAEDASKLEIVGERSAGLFRVTSVIGNASAFSQLLSFAIVVVLSGIFLQKRRKSRLLLTVLLGCLFAALLVTWGRAGILGTVFGVVLLIVSFPGSSFVKISQRLLAVILIVVLSLVVVSSISRLFPSYDVIGGLVNLTVQDVRDFSSLSVNNATSAESFLRRIYLERVALAAWESSPLVGVGTGGLRAFGGIDGVHNTWLLRLGENGILGFFFLTSMYIQMGRLAFRKWHLARANRGTFSSQEFWYVAFCASSPVLLAQLVLFSLTWGYWWQPFYTILVAFFGLPSYLMVSYKCDVHSALKPTFLRLKMADKAARVDKIPSTCPKP